MNIYVYMWSRALLESVGPWLGQQSLKESFNGDKAWNTGPFVVNMNPIWKTYKNKVMKTINPEVSEDAVDEVEVEHCWCFLDFPLSLPGALLSCPFFLQPYSQTDIWVVLKLGRLGGWRGAGWRLLWFTFPLEVSRLIVSIPGCSVCIMVGCLISRNAVVWWRMYKYLNRFLLHPLNPTNQTFQLPADLLCHL